MQLNVHLQLIIATYTFAQHVTIRNVGIYLPFFLVADLLAQRSHTPHEHQYKSLLVVGG